ncbi:MAG: outer membrane beta-barrel protein [Terracidiphilus sp.]|jgi:opacity protein-like surface antigen
MRKFVALFFVFACGLVLSSAQQQKPAASADKLEIFGGYSYSRASVINESPFPLSLNGGQASVAYYFTKHFGVKAEFAGYNDDVNLGSVNTQGYLFGPTGRIKVSPHFSIFAHQLFGVTHISMKADECEGTCSASTNSFTMASGGGVDFKLSKHISIRPAQMEYFTQQINLFDLEGGSPAAARAAAKPLAEDNPASSIKISSNGFRYSGGVVVHF